MNAAKLCRVDGCTRPRYGRGLLCSMHLARKRRTGEVGPAEPKIIKGDDRKRFWSKVRFSPDCWLWDGAKDDDGYGVFTVVRDGRQVCVRAHRFAFEDLDRPIPDGLTLDHLCGTPACVRPAHLEPVTAGVNAMRGGGVAAVNARRTHCSHGHPFDESNTYRYPNGERACRTCRREAKNRWAARKAGQ